MSRYRENGNDNNNNQFIEEFKTRVRKLLEAIKENTSDDTLVIWAAEMPIGKQPIGKLGI